MLHFTENISLHPRWLRRTRLIHRKQLPLSSFSQVLYLIYGKVTMIYQRAPSLNSSPLHPVDSSLLECELKAGIRFAPGLMRKRLRRWTTGCLARRVAKQSAAKAFRPQTAERLRKRRDICTCRRPTCKTVRSAPPITTALSTCSVFRHSNIHLRASELNFQMNSLLLPHFLTKDCIIHHNLLWRLILIRPFLKKGGALIIWTERTYSPPASNGNLPGYE